MENETIDDVALFSKRKKRRVVESISSAAKPTIEPVHERAAGTASTSLHHQDDPSDEVITFKSLGLSDWLCNVCRSLGMVHPTDVQKGCIPAILNGKDVIGLAQTGSGKTAAFGLPILQVLARDPFGVFALTLTPTRELAILIAEQYRALGAGMSLKECIVIGGADMQQQTRDLARRPHVVVATPGRLKGLMDADSSLSACFSRVRFLVLDEADRPLEPSFADELRTILSALPPDKRQTLLFSATMTRSLIDLQSASLKKAVVFEAYEGLQTAERLKEEYIFIPEKIKEVYLVHFLDRLAELKVRSAIIFCSTCKDCELLSLVLEQLGVTAAALHSGRPQRQRIAALAAFKSERVPLLLATDVASRGLDIPSVDLVVNFDLPILARRREAGACRDISLFRMIPSMPSMHEMGRMLPAQIIHVLGDYVHRVGRTARASRSGRSLSFVTQHDIDLVHKIEELIGHKMILFEMVESEVLKGITRVFAAKRAAALAEAEVDGVDKNDKRVKRIMKSNGKSMNI